MNEVYFHGAEFKNAIQTADGIQYICNAYAGSGSLKFTAAGSGPTLESAEEAAIKKVHRIANNTLDKIAANSDDWCEQQAYSERQRAKDALKGGGNKPASQPQKNLIQIICRENGLNDRDFVFEHSKMNMDNLSGAQADAVIKELLQKCSE